MQEVERFTESPTTCLRAFISASKQDRPALLVDLIFEAGPQRGRMVVSVVVIAVDEAVCSGSARSELCARSSVMVMFVLHTPYPS